MCTLQISTRPDAQVNAVIHLNEIKLYSPNGTRIPPSQLSAWMSSQLDYDKSPSMFRAANCIDGNDGPGPSGVVACHTFGYGIGSDPSPQLRVTFPCASGKAADAVSRVAVVNRQDCCLERITQYQLQLVDADGSVNKTFAFNGTALDYTFPRECNSLAPMNVRAAAGLNTYSRSSARYLPDAFRCTPKVRSGLWVA